MYNAFISYSHEADNKFAPALQNALQKFAKPWYKKRALEIFRDESSLSASPLLWTNIAKALDRSKFLIVLASPSSEKSKWVNQEIAYWLQHKSIDTILFALTDGNMEWDNENNCFLYPDNNSLPPALDGVFDSEPFYIDMRLARTEKDLSLDNPIFKKEVLKLAAKLHGRQPNDMASEEVTAHRKMMRIRNIALSLLLCLLIAALVAGYIANDQKNKATGLAGSNIKLAKAFESVYFYGGKFALSTDGLYFYFTDKNGDKVEKLGEWADAEQFNYTGYARVKKLEFLGSLFNAADDDFETGLANYIIDTSGNFYKAAYTIQDIDSTITAIDLSDKQLGTLPAAVFKNKNIEVLLLADNKLAVLPKEIGQLKKLKDLNISRNKLAGLPKEIGELKNLTTLDLRSNALTSLPKEIGQLTNLKQLHLLFSFTGMVSRNLDFTPQFLDFIPKEIGLLKNLTSLDLGMSGVAALPKEIAELKKLETLVLMGDSLAGLPKEIWEMKNLELLFLHQIPLNSLPGEIGKFKNLKVLSLSSTKLSVLPQEVGLLTNLSSLNLSNNDLQSLPKEIGGLKDLMILGLSDNELSELPAAIGELKNLAYLSLNGNKLSVLPKEIGDLKKLVSLNLKGNELSAFPNSIRGLKELTSLDLSENDLQFLPKEIGALKKLTSLSLRGNKLSMLPKEIGDLKKLKELDLSYNPLPPYEIEKIKKLLPDCKINHSFSPGFP